MEKCTILVAHSSHLNLYWMAAQAECLELGAGIVERGNRAGFTAVRGKYCVRCPYGNARIAGTLAASASLLDTGEAGVMSVFKESDYRPGEYIMRVFNPTPTPRKLSIGGSLSGKWECVNFDETPYDDPADTLGAFVIKTLRKR